MTFLQDALSKAIVWGNIALMIYATFIVKFYSNPYLLWVVDLALHIFVASFAIVIFTYKGNGFLGYLQSTLRR